MTKRAKLTALLLSLFFCAAALLILYCEKLQFIPAGSRSFWGQAGLCFVLCLPLFFLLFEKYLLPRLRRLPLREWLCMLLTAGFLAFFCMVWLPLPQSGMIQEHTLEIYPLPAEDGTVVPVALTWLRCDDQDISLKAFEGEGWWALQEDSVVAYDVNSRIRWHGRAGALAQMEFKAGEDGGLAAYSWDGREEQISLYSESVSRLSYERAFPPTFQLPEFLALFLLLFLLWITAYLYLFHQAHKLSVRSFFFLIAALFIFFRIKQFLQVTTVLTFSDSESYFGLSRLSLRELLSGEPYCFSDWYCIGRPILIPLLFKICRQNSAAISLAHLIISLGSWLFLAWRALKSCRTRAAQKAAAFLILGLGCVPNVTRWDQMMMSESLTISMMMLFFACCLWLSAPKEAGGWSLRAALAFALSALLACLTRDSTIWVVLLAVLLLAGLGFRREWRKPAWILALLVGALCIFLTGTMGDRWKFSYQNVLFNRILRDDAATQFFVEADMPLPEGTDALIGTEHLQTSAFFNSDAMRPLREWILSDGMGVYIRYMLRVPLHMLQTPWVDGFEQEAFEQIEFRYAPAGFTSLMPEALAKFFSFNLPGVLVMLLGVAGIVVAFHTRNGEALAFPVLFVLTAYLMGMAIWLTDSYDFPRHAMVTMLTLKAAAWILCCQMAERLAYRPEEEKK